MSTDRGLTARRDPTSGIKRDGVLAWLRLARVFQQIDRATAEHLRTYDLTVAQFDVIAQVGAAEGMSQQELARALLVTKGNVVQLLDRLEARGLIVRRPAGGSRRNNLYLTPAGWDVNRRAVPSQENLIADLFAGLSNDEQTQLLALLRKLDQSLDRRLFADDEQRVGSHPSEA